MLVCLNLCLNSSNIDASHPKTLEKEYQKVYKPILKFLYANPDFKFTFYFNGTQLSFYRKEHPEAIEILQSLINRKQVEILGGGYYNPIFPLLFPRDRTAQIDMLSSLIREMTGKRPRGCVICESIWDSSLVQCFSTSGMDYVILDENLVPPQKNKFIPLIMADKGKSISILSAQNSLKIETNSLPDDFLDSIIKKIEKSNKNSDDWILESEKNVTLQFSVSEFESVFSSKWVEKLYQRVLEQNDFYFGTPFNCVKSSLARIPAYISCGMSADIAQWAHKPYEAVKIEKLPPVTIYDFLQIYPQSRALYDRMLFLSLLANQNHGDKIRKKTAREKILESQNGNSFICTAKGAFVNSTYRQNSYKNLVEAEKILRESESFTESLSSFDYNGDGLNEYVFRMKDYFAAIELIGGAIREFDVMKSSGNYADNLSRVMEFEGCDEGYSRGFFIDHIFTDDEFSSYLQNKPSGNGIFSRSVYSELKVSSSHKEVELCARAIFAKKYPISLRKKYIGTSSGMMVQYILKNEGGLPLNAKFAVESSFAQINFNARDFGAYRLEIITNGEKSEIDTKSSSYELNSDGWLSNVEGFLLTDTDNSISFMFEPNEPSALSFVPIVFNRPEYPTGESVPASMTFANSLFWNVNLAPGMEMEKTINFSIFGMHKKRNTRRK